MKVFSVHFLAQISQNLSTIYWIHNSGLRFMHNHTVVQVFETSAYLQ